MQAWSSSKSYVKKLLVVQKRKGLTALYLKANFQVKFTSSGDDVFSRLFDDTLDHRIGLSQTFKTFNLEE